MSIQKKSLISTLKTAKKANVAGSSTHEVDAKGAKVASMRVTNPSRAIVSLKQATTRKTFKTYKSHSSKKA